LLSGVAQSGLRSGRIRPGALGVRGTFEGKGASAGALLSKPCA
jgi:hypothetical protein